MQIDVGFSDVITPGPEMISLPLILDLLPPPTLRAYPPETVIAEKLQTIIERGDANTRMKDFYDIWLLSRRFAIAPNDLIHALKRTFHHRDTPLSIAEIRRAIVSFSQLNATSHAWDRMKEKQLDQGESPASFEDLAGHLVRFLANLEGHRSPAL